MRVALIVLLVAFVPHGAAGQSPAVSGQVSDETGAVLSGVLVQLRTDRSTDVARTITDELGRYVLQTRHRAGTPSTFH